MCVWVCIESGRWLKKNKKMNKPPPFVSMPFGHGARMCIGRRFAEQEIYLAIIKVHKAIRILFYLVKSVYNNICNIYWTGLFGC